MRARAARDRPALRATQVASDAFNEPSIPTAPSSEPVRITEVSEEDTPRITTGIAPLDRVLGGGFVPGLTVLLGGAPGIGKSTLVAQLLAGIPDRSGPRLFATGEESVPMVRLRHGRVGALDGRIRVVREPDVDHVVAHAATLGAEVLAVDSVQTLISRGCSRPPGSVQQVQACLPVLRDYAHRTGAVVILVCQVDKGLDLAGPMTLQHLVDVVLDFQADDMIDQRRWLRGLKNRHGSTAVYGGFDMCDEGLVAVDDQPGEDPPIDELAPIAQELLYRVIELGGDVDAGLRDRIAGRLAIGPRGTVGG